MQYPYVAEILPTWRAEAIAACAAAPDVIDAFAQHRTTESIDPARRHAPGAREQRGDREPA